MTQRVGLSPTLRMANLLGDGEGLVVELLDELGGHLVRVVGRRVGALLLQEVDLDGHGADALLGLVKVVVGHCGDTQEANAWTSTRKLAELC